MSISSSGNSVASTPSADRYAALKDLDEQIREIKEKELIVHHQQQHLQQQPHHIPSVPLTNPNPFKVAQQQTTTPATNPFKTQPAVSDPDPFRVETQQTSFLAAQQPFFTGGYPISNNTGVLTNAFAVSFQQPLRLDPLSK